MRHDPTPTRLMMVGAEPDLQRACRLAAQHLGVPIDVLGGVEAALSWLLRPENLCTHVLVSGAIDPQRLDSLAGMVDEVTSRPTPILVLGAAEDSGPAVLAIPGPTAATIEQAVRGYRPFVPPERPHLTADDLRQSLHSGYLRMRFQPIVAAATLKPIGLESLARLHHPAFGILRPHEFMNLAEQSGQERSFAGIAAARSMLELRPLNGLPADGYFAINVPLATLCHQDAVERATELCAVSLQSPGNVAIELVETLREPNLAALAAAVARWRQAGFWVTIDDAGNRLPHWPKMLDLPFSGVKLDGALAYGSQADQDLAAAITDRAKRQGMFVIAEGIEDAAALARSRAHGVDGLQGFLFCRPLPARAVPIWVNAWETGLKPAGLAIAKH